MRAFERYHPLVLLTYFISVITITMLTLNPVLLAISLVLSVYFSGILVGIKDIFKSLLFSIIVLILITLTNPIFVHKGETVLFFLNSNPITLEAILYGLAAGVMIVSVFYWFKAFHIIMTSDKHIYLFGKISSKFSLLLSMILAFIPKLKRQYQDIDNSLKALGVYSTKSYTDKIKNKFLILSMLITWGLENSIETADSMKARGYGLKGRTSYSNFTWERKDITMIILILLINISVIVFSFYETTSISFYPTLGKINTNPLALASYILIFILMAIPTIIEVKENITWQYLKSKI